MTWRSKKYGDVWLIPPTIPIRRRLVARGGAFSANQWVRDKEKPCIFKIKAVL
jgi:hypothetical protein